MIYDKTTTLRALLQRKKNLSHTAVHEGAHAVIARVLTLASGEATIKPDYRERSAGYSWTADPYECLSEWRRRGKVREPDAAFHGRIIVYMAGIEGEAELLGVTE
jgi:hypothetical protein